MCSQLLISGEAIKMNTGEMHQTSKALRTVLVDLRMGVLLLSGLFPFSTLPMRKLLITLPFNSGLFP